MFESVLIGLVKFSLLLVLIIFTLRWIFVVPYLWFRYDMQILKLKKGLDEFRKQQRSKPITQQSVDGAINQRTIFVTEELEIIETSRRLFIDRVNLFLSISSINKS